MNESALGARLATSARTQELRAALREVCRRLKNGDASTLLVWVIAQRLACGHRPLRCDPMHGGSRVDLPESAAPTVTRWIERIYAEGIRGVISLLHAKEVAHYRMLDLGATDLHAAYSAHGLTVVHIPWDDPAHRAHDEHSFHVELARVASEALKAYEQLPKPVLLHCSAGIDRSSPIATHLFECDQNGPAI